MSIRLRPTIRIVRRRYLSIIYWIIRALAILMIPFGLGISLVHAQNTEPPDQAPVTTAPDGVNQDHAETTTQEQNIPNLAIGVSNTTSDLPTGFALGLGGASTATLLALAGSTNARGGQTTASNPAPTTSNPAPTTARGHINQTSASREQPSPPLVAQVSSVSSLEEDENEEAEEEGGFSLPDWALPIFGFITSQSQSFWQTLVRTGQQTIIPGFKLVIENGIVFLKTAAAIKIAIGTATVTGIIAFWTDPILDEATEQAMIEQARLREEEARRERERQQQQTPSAPPPQLPAEYPQWQQDAYQFVQNVVSGAYSNSSEDYQAAVGYLQSLQTLNQELIGAGLPPVTTQEFINQVKDRLDAGRYISQISYYVGQAEAGESVDLDMFRQLTNDALFLSNQMEARQQGTGFYPENIRNLQLDWMRDLQQQRQYVAEINDYIARVEAGETVDYEAFEQLTNDALYLSNQMATRWPGTGFYSEEARRAHLEWLASIQNSTPEEDVIIVGPDGTAYGPDDPVPDTQEPDSQEPDTDTDNNQPPIPPTPPRPPTTGGNDDEEPDDEEPGVEEATEITARGARAARAEAARLRTQANQARARGDHQTARQLRQEARRLDRSASEMENLNRTLREGGPGILSRVRDIATIFAVAAGPFAGLGGGLIIAVKGARSSERQAYINDLGNQLRELLSDPNNTNPEFRSFIDNLRQTNPHLSDGYIAEIARYLRPDLWNIANADRYGGPVSTATYDPPPRPDWMDNLGALVGISNDYFVDINELNARLRQLEEQTTARYSGVTDYPEVTLNPEVEGQLTTVNVREGDRVEAGQELATIENTEQQNAVREAESELASRQAELAQSQQQVDSARQNVTQAQADVAQAQAEVEQARANLDQAQREADRRQQLFDQGAISQEALEQAQRDATNARNALTAAQQNVQSLEAVVAQAQTSVTSAQSAVSGAQARVQQQEAVVAQAREALQRTVITAPMDGVVLERPPIAGTTVNTDTQLFRIGNPDQLRATVQVPLNVAVQEGQEVTVNIRGVGSVQGRVITIDPVANQAADAKLVEVEIPNPGDVGVNQSIDVIFDAPAAPANPQPQSYQSPPIPTTPIASSPQTIIYTVQPGDTLETIAQRFYGSENTIVPDIAQLNALQDSEILQTGQEVQVPIYN